MSACQVIKGNGKSCRNYAINGKTCCWSHRRLETGYIVPVAPEPKPIADPDICHKIGCKIKADCVLKTRGTPDTYSCWRHWY